MSSSGLPLISLNASSSVTKLPLSPSSFLPKRALPNSETNLSHQPPIQNLDHSRTRRGFSLLSFLTLVPSVTWPSRASAFSIGISGPKDWLKEQKRKASKFLLAPIDASRESIRSAYLILSSSSGPGYANTDLEEVQSLVRSAARDCVPMERSSLVSFQASTGVEVCTFRLIVKNASSLLDDKDPVKLKAEAMLDDLIRSFNVVFVLAKEINMQLPSSRREISEALQVVLSTMDKFEQGVKNCLEV